MRRGRPVTAEELDALGAEPAVGEVWWCDGAALGLSDGGKTRPVLVVARTGDHTEVIPLTTRKPAGPAVAVGHRAGVSWLMNTQRAVSRLALLSSLGLWTGYEVWRRR